MIKLHIHKTFAFLLDMSASGCHHPYVYCRYVLSGRILKQCNRHGDMEINLCLKVGAIKWATV